MKMYRMYREIQNLEKKLPEILKLSQNLSESSRMTPDSTIALMIIRSTRCIIKVKAELKLLVF